MGDKRDKPSLEIIQPGEPPKPEFSIETHMECTFRGVGGTYTYPIPRTEEDRLQSILLNDKKAFLAITTLDWRAVFINLRFLLECYLWTAPHQTVERAGGVMKCRYAGGHLSEHEDVDLRYLDLIDMNLDTMGKPMDRFLSVPMEISGELLLNTADLVYLEYPDYWRDLADEEREEE